MRPVSVILAAWVAALGFDLFLHAGVLGSLYLDPGPFLLEPMEAFRRIPAGYLAFLVLTASLYWLLRRLEVLGALKGAATGAMAGAVLWGAFLLGLWSISSAQPPLLLGWWAGQTVEFGISGAVVGGAAAGLGNRALWARVLAFVVVLVVITFGMQSLGITPALVSG